MGRDCWWNRNASTRVIQFGAPWKWTHKNTIVQSKKLAEGGCCRVKWSGWEGWRTRRMFANDMARLGGKHVNNNNIARTLIRLMLSTYALATAIDSVYTTGFSLHPREALPTWRAASKETWWWWRKVCDQRPPGLPTTTTTTTAALHIFSTKVTLRDPRHSAGHHDSCVPWRRFLYIREKKKERKKSFAGPEVSRHLGNPLAADGKIVTTFFLAHKVFFFATGPIKLVLSSTKLVSAGLLGSFRLSDAEGIQTVGGFSLSLSSFYFIPHKCWFVARAALDWCSNWQMINTDARRRRVVQILAHYLCTSALFLSHLLCLVIHQLIGCARHFDETDVPLLPLSNDLFFHCLTLSTVSVETRWHLLRLFTLAPLPHCV